MAADERHPNARSGRSGTAPGDAPQLESAGGSAAGIAGRRYLAMQSSPA